MDSVNHKRRPSALLLDAGSPLLWFNVFHLFIGNALIGLLEVWVVNRIWHIKLRWWLIIIANYVSMIAGMEMIAPYFTRHVLKKQFMPAFDAPSPVSVFLAGMLISYLVTIVVEYPFFYFATKGGRSYRESTKMTIVANAVSYLLMLAIYLLSFYVS